MRRLGLQAVVWLSVAYGLAFAAQPDADTALRQVRASLRGDIGLLVLGIVITAAGLAAVAVYLLSSKPRERLLLWFSLFSGLYGVRLLSNTWTIQTLLGLPNNFWPRLQILISYVIVIPFGLFFEEWYGKGWKSTMRWLVWILCIYAAVAMVAGTIPPTAFAFPDPAAALLVFLPLVLVVNWMAHYRPAETCGSRPMVAGMVVFILSVFNEHLVGANLLPWRWRVEPIAFFAFVCCLGYVAARRFLETSSNCARSNRR